MRGGTIADPTRPTTCAIRTTITATRITIQGSLGMIQRIAAMSPEILGLMCGTTLKTPAMVAEIPTMIRRIRETRGQDTTLTEIEYVNACRRQATSYDWSQFGIGSCPLVQGCNSCELLWYLALDMQFLASYCCHRYGSEICLETYQTPCGKLETKAVSYFLTIEKGPLRAVTSYVGGMWLVNSFGGLFGLIRLA